MSDSENAVVSIESKESAVYITMDDGKSNAVSPAMLRQLNVALDQAEAEGKVVVLAGRPGRFSAGFDLNIMKQGGDPMMSLVGNGALLALRLLTFPTPIVAACTGHGLAMGGLMLLAADYRVGITGDFKIGLNEVAIGMVMPQFGVELGRGKLSVPYFGRAVSNAEIFRPENAVAAGFLDAVTAADTLIPTILDVVEALSALDMSAHHGTKLRVKAPVIDAVSAAIDQEFGQYIQR